MNQNRAIRNSVEILIAARRVANFASQHGLPADRLHQRVVYRHIGALLADSVLQAGLNYRTVVKPRIQRILIEYPEANNTGGVLQLVLAGWTSKFLNWEHHVKIARFERLVAAVHFAGIYDTDDLSNCLRQDSFCLRLQELHGVGPKTIDYMACLVGIESIAVDRHIRSFAGKAGIERTEYSYLKSVFCAAADLMSVSRREFDTWVWQQESRSNDLQMSFF